MNLNSKLLHHTNVRTLSPTRFKVTAVAEWSRYRIVAGLVMSSTPVPLKTLRVGVRCTLNLSRAQTTSRWCGVEFWRGGCQLRDRPRHLTLVLNDEARRQSPRVTQYSVTLIFTHFIIDQDLA
ncbi:uncharacterized protein TNCV_101931 [Trichonephila clavipes]|nr:uncharacterized protein TNCV_101931 [Trichonephila clavipes]